MRKVFLSLLLLLAMPVASMAQEMSDAVYLKNGSIIRGVVIEQVPGKSLKVQTPDGSVFAYDMSEVERITKEALPASSSRSGTTSVQRGYRGFFDIGYTIGTGDLDDIGRMEFSTTHGYQFNPHFFFGVGMGVTYWHEDGMECVGLPIFADVRVDILKSWVTPFLDFKIGYSVVDVEGVYFAQTVGCRFDVDGKVGLNLGIGYTVQKVEWQHFYNTTKINMGGFHLKFGVSF